MVRLVCIRTTTRTATLLSSSIRRGTTLKRFATNLRLNPSIVETTRAIRQAEVGASCGNRDANEDARGVELAIAKAPDYGHSRHRRKKVEMLFAHLKRILRWARLRLRSVRRAR